MQSLVTKSLLVFVLCIVAYVKAENQVTIIDFNVDIPDNEVVASWSYELNNNLINSDINIKQNCPGLIEADITVYQGDVVINQMNQKYKQPIKDFEDYKICASLDRPDMEDDSCSIAEGDQTVRDCDISGWFSDMSPGDYRIECNFKHLDAILAAIVMNVKVE